MARLDAASALDTAGVPALQLGEVQTGRVAIVRRAARDVCVAPCSLHVLLATVLLGLAAWRECRMSPRRFQDSRVVPLHTFEEVPRKANLLHSWATIFDL
jgi:hypothetical protein